MSMTSVAGLPLLGLASVQAAVPTDEDARDEVRDVLMASVNAGNAYPATTVAVTEIYRCETGADFVTVNNCTDANQVSTFIKIALTDTYTPQWTSFGIGRMCGRLKMNMSEASYCTVTLKVPVAASVAADCTVRCVDDSIG